MKKQTYIDEKIDGVHVAHINRSYFFHTSFCQTDSVIRKASVRNDMEKTEKFQNDLLSSLNDCYFIGESTLFE